MKDFVYSDSDKKDILISALEKRYEAMQAIRERVQGVGLWALGLMLAASGWLIQGEISLAPKEKFFCAVGLFFASWALRFRYLKDLETGFLAQQRVAVRLETALGFYASGIFDGSEDSIYPNAWKLAGSEQGEGRFFSSTYILLYIGIAILLATILFQCSSGQYYIVL